MCFDCQGPRLLRRFLLVSLCSDSELKGVTRHYDVRTGLARQNNADLDRLSICQLVHGAPASQDLQRKGRESHHRDRLIPSPL